MDQQTQAKLTSAENLARDYQSILQEYNDPEIQAELTPYYNDLMAKLLGLVVPSTDAQHTGD
jgi:hypothetical protein